MNISEFKSGIYKDGFQYKYFLPNNINHEFMVDDIELISILEKASLKIGELNTMSDFIPDTDLFIKMHVMKEAVVSSKIEGTRTNMTEAFTEKDFINDEKRDDWQEVSNYTKSLNSAIGQLSKLPLSNRLIKDCHKQLMSGVRGQNKTPGEFRHSQNWIGGASLLDATFIPPHHENLSELLSDFEKFLNNSSIKVPNLVKIAIAHYQFETIHPFLDGNGRVGRLLITLFLVEKNILSKPLLYLSDFFEKNKSLYYDNLTRTRTHSDLIQWIKFFLVGILETSEKAISTLKEIINLKKNIENRFIKTLGSRSSNAYLLLDSLFKNPITTIKKVQEVTGLSANSASALISDFEKANVLVQINDTVRNRRYVFLDYLNLFED